MSMYLGNLAAFDLDDTDERMQGLQPETVEEQHEQALRHEERLDDFAPARPHCMTTAPRAPEPSRIPFPRLESTAGPSPWPGLPPRDGDGPALIRKD